MTLAHFFLATLLWAPAVHAGTLGNSWVPNVGTQTTMASTTHGHLRSRALQDPEAPDEDIIICKLTQNDVEFEDEGIDDEPYLCELYPEYADGVEGIELILDGLDPNFVEEHDMVPGKTSFVVTGGVIDEDTLVLSSSSSITVVEDDEATTSDWEAANQASTRARGTKSVLVIRVSGQDSQPAMSPYQIADAVFGGLVGGSDSVNLASQYKACSYDKLQLQPATGTNVDKGVYDMHLSLNLRGRSNVSTENSVKNAAARAGLNLRAYDHYMMVFPNGVRKRGKTDWVAYASRPGSRSVYNDRWVEDVSTQMHEIGHNLGLRHSGDSSWEYGDTSGMMGGAHGKDTLRMCFNAAKSYELGWYFDRHDMVDPSRNSFSGKLIGVSDYAASVAGHTVVLRIQKGGADWYMTYNRKAGINEDTVENGNKVTIVQAGSEGSSYLVQALSSGQSYNVQNFDGSGRQLRIKVTGTGFDGSVNYAAVTVALDGTAGPRPGNGNEQPIRVMYNNECLDMSRLEGNNVYAHPCHGGLNQLWYVDKTTQQIKNAESHLCLDYAINGPGTPGNVYADECHSGKDQKWQWDGGRLVSLHDGKCLDMNLSTKNIYMHSCHEHTNQQFLVPSGFFSALQKGNAYVEFRSDAFANKCLDSKLGKSDNGNAIWLYECNGTPAQLWRVDNNGYIHSALDDNKCLVPEGEGDNGKSLVLWDCDPFKYNTWTHNSDGTLRTKADTNKCVDIADEDQQTIQVWECNGRQDKVWEAIPASVSSETGGSEGGNANYCGTSWAAASSSCGTRCPAGVDGECPSGTKCFADVTSCNSEIGSSPGSDSGVDAGKNYCGTSWVDASSSCGTRCPGGLDGECPSGTRCFADVTSCDVAIGKSGGDSIVGNTNYCGTSWTDASCGAPCPGGMDSECPSGTRCFADVSC